MNDDDQRVDGARRQRVERARPHLDEDDRAAFAAIRKELRRNDARWYLRCRLRSLLERLLDGAKFSVIGSGPYWY